MSTSEANSTPSVASPQHSYRDVRFPWKRYWAPAGAKAQLFDDGYLWEPQSDRWNVINKELQSLDELTQTPCLILLGEPGLGKTHELMLAAEQSRIDESANVFELDLTSCEDSQDIKDVLADASQRIHATQAGTRIYMFVDGLD